MPMTSDEIGQKIIDAILDGWLLQVECRRDRSERCGHYPYCFVTANAAEQIGELAKSLVNDDRRNQPPDPVG